MMPAADIAALHRARRLCVQAARILDVAKYRPHPGYWPFSSQHPSYHDLLDPAATDGRRSWAASWLLSRLDRHIREEQCSLKRDERISVRTSDPYGSRWRTTPRGALLEIAANLLRQAEEIFSEAGVEAECPTLARYAAL
jgi:hypothetical protein